MKRVGVSLQIYDLIKVLEESEDKVDFTVFYSFAEILESHNFCPAWDFEGAYYEIQYDDEDNLQVLDFGYKGNMEIGKILTEKEIVCLTSDIKKL